MKTTDTGETPTNVAVAFLASDMNLFSINALNGAIEQVPDLRVTLCLSKRVDCGENVRTPRSIGYVCPSPGKEPRENVHSRVLISVHHESTILARSTPQKYSPSNLGAAD